METAMKETHEEELFKDWGLSWTADGGRTWHEAAFYTFGQAQDYARELERLHGGEKGFSMSAKRMMFVNTTSFLDAETAGDVELAPHPLKTAEAFA